MFLSSKQVSKLIKLILLLSKKCDGQVRDKQISVPVISTAKDTSIGISAEIDGYDFEVVKDFVYLGSSINTDKDMSLAIRRRITLG